MILNLLLKVILLLEGGEVMMALLLAQRVILGKTEFNDVPDSLKPQVYEHLVDSGVEFLAGDYVPPVTP